MNSVHMQLAELLNTVFFLSRMGWQQNEKGTRGIYTIQGEKRLVDKEYNENTKHLC